MNGGQRKIVDKRPPEPDLDLDGWWWAMVILGVAIIVLFGFFFCIEPSGRLVARTDDCTDHWRSWEMGAVLWAILFGVYYFIRFPQLPEGTRTKIICALIFGGSIVANVVAAIFILTKPAVWHVGAVIAGSALFMAADYFLYRWLTNKRQRCSFFEGFLLADIPMVAGLVTLMFYLLMHPGEGKSHEEMEAFAGGAISFQLIAANVIFVLSQGGFIRWMWVRNGSEDKSTPKARIKGPLEHNPWAGTALTFGLMGSMVPLIRLADGSWSPWLSAIGLIAIVTGVLGRRTADQHAGAGKGTADTALTLGVLGLVAAVLVTPPGTIFSATVLRSVQRPSGDQKSQPFDNKEWVKSLAVSPDGELLARGGETTLKVFNTKNQKSIGGEREIENGPILAMAFSPDGKTLASGGTDLNILLWNTQGWTPTPMQRDTEDRQSTAETADEVDQGDPRNLDVLSLAFSPEGRLLAAGVADNSIRFWDTETRKPVQVWDTRTGEQKIKLEKHRAPVNVLAFSADGRWLVSGGNDDEVVLWSITKKWLVNDNQEEEKELFRVETDGGVSYRSGESVKSVAISRNGGVLAAGLSNGRIRIWDRLNSSPKVEVESKGPVLALRFSDDALVLASVSCQSGVQLWDTQSGDRKRLMQMGGPANVMDLSRDGGTLAGGSESGDLTVWWAY